MFDKTLTDSMVKRWLPMKENGYRMSLNCENGYGRVYRNQGTVRDARWGGINTLVSRYSKKFYFGKIETRDEFEFAVNKMITYMERRFKIIPEKKQSASQYLDLVAKLGGMNV